MQARAARFDDNLGADLVVVPERTRNLFSDPVVFPARRWARSRRSRVPRSPRGCARCTRSWSRRTARLRSPRPPLTLATAQEHSGPVDPRLRGGGHTAGSAPVAVLLTGGGAQCRKVERARTSNVPLARSRRSAVVWPIRGHLGSADPVIGRAWIDLDGPARIDDATVPQCRQPEDPRERRQRLSGRPLRPWTVVAA